MGITIVQKSDLSVRKKEPKIALVLAGGAVTGGAFKLGGLKALDDFLVNKKTTEFDTYVGLSAGAVLAAPLAAGVSPAEMLKSLEGKSTQFDHFRPGDVYAPAWGDFVSRPAQFAFDVLTFLPGTVGDLLRQVPRLARKLQEPLAEAWRNPSTTSLQELLTPIGEAIAGRRGFPSPLDYLPSGFFDNSSIERYLRRNFEASGIPNDFRDLYRETKKELYIGAMNLDSAERVVFGYDEDTSVTVSEAVQASTALPGFYKPARIRGVDYVDGGVRRTANIDVAIEHGADLVICYNPFRPFSNRVRRTVKNGEYEIEGQLLAETGILTVINQVFRTLLHSRLQYGLRQYQDDPNFRGDIVVVEPKETDRHIFQLSAMAYWQRLSAAQYGYVSVTESIEQNYDLIKHILESYGVSMTRRQARAGVERIREEDPQEVSKVLLHDVPRRNLSVA
ncbi:MAG TPA: patatin-like phospholipase family protein [Candidatus Margulisiibacteriota bacterium]|nr:patatin-like phospholipase family protein [Candidatus Margulisiibacteriota bacterium]